MVISLRRIFFYFKFKILLHFSATFLRFSFALPFSVVLILSLRSNFPALLFSHFFQIFFYRYRQLISFSSFAVAKLSRKLNLPFECLFLFSQSEVRYFILQDSLSQNDSSKLTFSDVWSMVHRFMLKSRTLRLHTLN